MLRRLRLWHVVVILLSIFVVSVGLVWAGPTSGVVGDGTPESCDGNALEAVLATGGMVSFDCGPNPVSIAVNTMVIEKDATLDGDLVTLWGEDLRQIFIVNPGVNFVLRNITLTGGSWYGDGGAITNYGNLTLESSTISSSWAEGEASRGGAIFNDGGTLSLYDSYLLSNRAGQYGGGIASNGGTVYMTRTTIQENYAPKGGGGLWNANAEVTIEESRITENSAQSDGQGNFGGGLYNLGRMTVRRSTIDYNTATDGGGIYTQGGDNSLWVEGSTISGNFVPGGAGGLQLGDGTTTIINTSVSGNSAGSFAGGVESGAQNGSQTFQNVTVYGNSAPTGANFYQDEGEVVISPSIRNTIIANPLGEGANCA